MTSRNFPLHRLVSRDEVPEEGLEIAFDASPEELAALAAYLDVVSVASMSARLTLTRWRGRGLAVTGEVEARVVQTCIVTLEPVENEIREEVASYFAPDAAPRLAGSPALAADVPEIDIEPLVDGRVDVGALAAEHLALGLDPYPRKPGVVFEGESREDGGQGAGGAFAALSALRRGRKGD